MRVIGTAGHVDHGKSALIEALTGTHPDRLREEQERGLTIVLGFAWLTLPGGEEVGIVDVPGHRDFIENMLAGVGAIDAALFVVAADEGVMPQTREHLAILDLLQINGGVVALTKVDLIDDPEWLDLVEGEVRETLQGTVLADAPLVRVSARTGEGIPELVAALERALAEKPPRPDLGRPRLSVDRVFTVAGFGTVVTGTLTDGHLSVGDELVVLPAGHRGRVRGLQTHKRKEQMAVPGSRTAINISGVDAAQIERGDVVTHPGAYQPTRRLDVRFRLLPEASQPLRHDQEMKFFIGAAEVMARVRLLGSETLQPGESGWLQLELPRPVVAVRGDRFILRRPSPPETIGGGMVIDPHPARRHKRFAQHVLNRLHALAQGSPDDVVLEVMAGKGVLLYPALADAASLEAAVLNEAIERLVARGDLILLRGAHPAAPKALLTARGYWEQLLKRAVQLVEDYHAALPFRPGMSREELKSRLNLDAAVFNAMIDALVERGELVEKALRANLPGISPIPALARPDFQPSWQGKQAELVDALLERFAASPYSPPTIKETIAAVGEEIYNALLDREILMPVSEEVAFRLEDYHRMVAQVKEMIQQQGGLTVAQARDRFQTTRRYVLDLLEHLDAIGVTVRQGDVRVLK
ncbi:MAG: selenocysteine-specific translation elongation factor [Anaerolineae bacterium]|nr:MAG: selenocysteine-specific translation elongation factor [Anaerolineae bacterium]